MGRLGLFLDDSLKLKIWMEAASKWDGGLIAGMAFGRCGLRLADVTQTKTKSRARIRKIPAGYCKQCASCGRPITFNMKDRPKQVICNVAVKGVWNRVEHWHEVCYDGRHGDAL